MKSLRRTLPLFLSLLILPATAEARPESITPRLSYYAEDYMTKGEVSEIGVEKNFEEVYKNYEYYESVYDENKRARAFRSYKRGDLVLTENYSYGPEGHLQSKEIVRGKEVETILFDKMGGRVQ